jgi:hypothetical protein
VGQRTLQRAKLLHHLALLVSITVASTLIPKLFVPENLHTRFAITSSREDVRKVFEDINWIHKPGKKGMAERSIFVTMVTSFIIAIYEPESPLRRYTGTASKNGLGNAWRDKNCQHFHSYSVSSDPFFSHLGHVYSRKRNHLYDFNPAEPLVGQGPEGI